MSVVYIYICICSLLVVKLEAMIFGLCCCLLVLKLEAINFVLLFPLSFEVGICQFCLFVFQEAEAILFEVMILTGC